MGEWCRYRCTTTQAQKNNSEQKDKARAMEIWDVEFQKYLPNVSSWFRLSEGLKVNEPHNGVYPRGKIYWFYWR